MAPLHILFLLIPGGQWLLGVSCCPQCAIFLEKGKTAAAVCDPFPRFAGERGSE